MSKDVKKWLADKMTWLSLGVACGITGQKMLPYNEWAGFVWVVVFFFSCYAHTLLSVNVVEVRGGE